MNLGFRGVIAPANGWLGRAQRLLDRQPGTRSSRGLMIPAVFRLEAGGDFEAAAALAGEAAAVAERLGARPPRHGVPERAGDHARAGRPRSRRIRAPRRGDGDRDDERPHAVRARNRLLRRDPRLSRGLRGRPGA
jgi:hypothetical protein